MPDLPEKEIGTFTMQEKDDLSSEKVGARFIAPEDPAPEDPVCKDPVVEGDVCKDPVVEGDVCKDPVVEGDVCNGDSPNGDQPDEDEVYYDDPYFDSYLARCIRCGADVEYYTDWGEEPYCKYHSYEASRQQCQASPALFIVTQGKFFLQNIITIQMLLLAQDSSTGPFPVALDLETTGLSPQQDRIISITLGIPDRVCVLDMRPYYNLSPERQELWKAALQDLFDKRSRIVWVGHNLKFDGSFLAVQFGVRLSQVYDTMLAEQVLHAGHDTPKGFFSLLETAQRYNLKVNKQQREWFIGLDTRAEEWEGHFPDQQLVYMVQDVDIPYRIAELQRPLLAQQGLERVVQLENQALPALVSMEVHGVLIDRDRWKSILADKQARKEEIEHELVETLGSAIQKGREQNLQDQKKQREKYKRQRTTEGKRLLEEDNNHHEVKGKTNWSKNYRTGIKAWDAMHPERLKPETPSHTINLNAPRQVKEALAYLGIKVESTEEEVLECYRHEHPIIEKLFHWRKLNHFCQSFGENILAHIKADGRIHASFDQARAVSGRITCREPNLQQIPKQEAGVAEEEDVRRCFIAPEGSYILAADLSNIELRILAEISVDPVMLELFAQGKDMHAETARAMFGLSAEIDTRKHLYNGIVVRDIAKTINFGLIYGMGVQTLASRIGVSMEEAQKLINGYFATYAGIHKWLRQATAQAMESGYATTLAGRKRHFTLTGQRAAIERAARNHPIQGTNADILKRALALLYETLPESVHLLLCVHDEIVLESPEDQLEVAERTLKGAMVQACREFLKVVAIPEPEVVVGRAWSKK
jgi:DNA polymerase-1